MRLLAPLFCLLAASPVLAQSAPSGPMSGSGQDVVVTGKREDDRARAAHYVRHISQVPVAGQYGRWHDPICARVTGLDEATAAFVRGRIERIAAGWGLAIGPSDCRANLVVIFTDDGDASLRDMEKKGLAFPRSVPLADRQAIRIEGQPVRWWAEVVTQGADGERLDTLPSTGISNIADLRLPTDDRTTWTSSYSPSMIASKVRVAIPAAVAIVDVTAASGKRLSSLSDHLAFLILGRAKGGAGIGIPTIARLFDPSCSDCDRLSVFDRAYLDGLYGSPANRPASVTRATLTHRVAGAR